MIIISGPESSGNRLLYDMLRELTEWKGDSVETDKWWREEAAVRNAGDIITLRSMPHGALGHDRRLYDLEEFYARATQVYGRVDVVIPIRDQNIVTISKANKHLNGDLDLARKELQEAWKTIHAMMSGWYRGKVHLFSYESLCFLGYAYFRELLKRMHLGHMLVTEKSEVMRRYSIRDGNLPHLKDAWRLPSQTQRTGGPKWP